MKHKLAVVALAVVLAGGFYLNQRTTHEQADVAKGLRLSALLSGPADGFAAVEAPREFEFPLDHGAHRAYRTEWWYFTGHLQSESGHRLGFQLTFFRFALSAPKQDQRSSQLGDVTMTDKKSESRWETNNVYMAHFAVSDISGGAFHSFERVSREAIGLAGATAAPFSVWTEDWSATSEAEAFLPMHLAARDDDVWLSLSLSPGKSMVTQGDNGYSQKSDEPGNASHYYSFTRLPARGQVSLTGEPFSVSGNVWLDREWSTSALAVHQIGWNWFALQLDDGREIMFYQLRNDDGGVDSHSAGVLVNAHGSTLVLSARDVSIEVLEHWTVPGTQTRYPVRWRMSIERLAMSFDIAADIVDQEHTHSVRYWEGAASVEGFELNEAIQGRAYVELTGYVD